MKERACNEVAGRHPNRLIDAMSSPALRSHTPAFTLYKSNDCLPLKVCVALVNYTMILFIRLANMGSILKENIRNDGRY